MATAGVVHDLGNLIQIAVSAMNLVARNPLLRRADELDPMVARARVSLERAAALVQETLAGAHGVEGMEGLVDIQACLNDVRVLLATDVSPIRFVVQAGSDLPRVRCSRVGLQNAVLNLVLNAQEAMPAGGDITITATTPSPDAAAIALRVADNGAGMDAETLARAFEPFFTTKRPGLGGCGLAMVQRFAQDAAGRVEIESQPGVGTAVTLWLPAVRQVAS
jgi:signal transduction histidine kinase